MTWHPEILSDGQRSVIGLIAPVVTDLGFYLGGGTALALQLGHRMSEDFDWFTPDEIPDPRWLLAELRDAGVPLANEEIARGTVHGSVQGVKISLMEFRWALLEPRSEWKETGAKVASLADLAAMKLEAVASRGTKRDFVDVWALFRELGPLDTLLASYSKRFPKANLAHLLVALAYFDDAERDPMPMMLWEVDWQTVRSAIERSVKQVAWPDRPSGR